jgi:hypothetical protein
MRRQSPYLFSAIALLTTGVACMAIGLASEAKTFLWMVPGFLAPGLVLALLAMRRRVR